MRGLRDKRVLITGGASGIGAAAAARFLEEHARVAVLDCDADGRRRILGELPALAGAVAADVSRLDEVERAFGEAAGLLGGGVDVLINNAGISIRHRFLEITPADWDRVLAVNLTGAFYVAQTAARHMMGRGGVILNTASTNGIVGYPFYADYNAAKAGLIELTRSMALELAPTVRVNAVAPGYVLTPMQRAEYTDEMLAEVNRKIPLGRHARPDEVAALFAFLASDDAAFISGHVYTLDGAETAGGLASR